MADATRITALSRPVETLERTTVQRTLGGRYRLGRVLGAGGMGTVHEALDIEMDRPVAIKLLRREIASDPHQLQRFEREARAAAKLAHPNVIGVTELVRDDALGLGLVMELLAGESLATRLERGPLAEDEAVNVMLQALDGLAAAHAAGMVHRDLKPSNVFLVPIASGVLVKVLDFGIVKLAEDGAVPKLTRQGTLIGTPTYMSPEQVSCAPVDARSDVYSMGACLYESLVARPPYEAPHSLALVAAVGAGPPRDLHEIDREVSPDLVHVVRVAMSRDALGRYQTVQAMREALRGAVVQSGPRRSPRPAAPSALASRETTKAAIAVALPDSRRRYAAIVLAAVAIVGIAIAIGARARGGPPVPPRPSLPPTTVTNAAPPAPSIALALPRGLEAPEPPPSAPATTSVRSATPSARPPRAPRPPPSSDPPPRHGRVGVDVLDPFAE